MFKTLEKWRGVGLKCLIIYAWILNYHISRSVSPIFIIFSPKFVFFIPLADGTHRPYNLKASLWLVRLTMGIRRALCRGPISVQVTWKLRLNLLPRAQRSQYVTSKLWMCISCLEFITDRKYQHNVQTGMYRLLFCVYVVLSHNEPWKFARSDPWSDVNNRSSASIVLRSFVFTSTSLFWSISSLGNFTCLICNMHFHFQLEIEIMKSVYYRWNLKELMMMMMSNVNQLSDYSH